MVSPADADPDTLGHQVALAAPAAGQDSTDTVVAVVVTAQDGTRNTYAVVVTRPAAAPSAEITMQLPEGCVLHDLGEGNRTPRRRWDDDCDSLYNNSPQRAAQYYRLYMRRESLVRLKVEGDSSSDLLIRSSDGRIIARDGKGNPQYYDAELTVTLPRGVYVVEAAAHWHHFNRRGHRLRYEGEGIARPYGYRLDGLAISDVNLAAFDTDTTEYTRHVAADVDSVTVTTTASSDESAVEISPADSAPSTDGHQVALEADGSTDITVSVVSVEFPNLTTAYSVSLTRLEGSTSPLSADATLSAPVAQRHRHRFLRSRHRRVHRQNLQQPFLCHCHSHRHRPVRDRGHHPRRRRPPSPTATRSVWLWARTPSPSGSGPLTARLGGAIRSRSIGPRSTRSGGFPPRTWTCRRLLRTSSRSGVWSDGATVWVSDWDDDKIYAYALAGGTRAPDRDIDTLVAAGNNSPNGLWSDGATVWVTDQADDKAYAYDLTTGTRKADKEINTLAAAGNNSPEGLWSDGETLWVADQDDNKVYAYHLDSGIRRPGRDINTLAAAGNNKPQGVWSDGADDMGCRPGRRQGLRLRPGHRHPQSRQGDQHFGRGGQQQP